MKIWSNVGYGDEVLGILRVGVGTDELILPGSIAELSEADAVFGPPEVEAVMAAPMVRWIHLDTAGYERYDREDFREHVAQAGVRVTNSSSVYAEPCAQHVVAMIYGVSRRLSEALEVQRGDQSWPMMKLRAASRLLTGESAVLLGYGAIGRRVVELLEPLRMRLTGYRRHPDGSESIPMVSGNGLTAVLAEADHVINILPASSSTRGFCDAQFFGKMKAGAIFYNIGRGSTVDQEALLEALESGRMGAACLDVTDPEPLPPDHRLWSAPNCLITPHSAGGHETERKRLVAHFLENLRRFRAGEELIDRILER